MSLFALSPEQVMLDEAATDFARSARPIEAIRRSEGDPRPIPRDYIRASAELGWFGSLIEEELGGFLAAPEDARNAVVLARASGRLLQPTNYVSTNVVGVALAAAQNDVVRDWLPSLISGERSAAWAYAAPAADSSTSLGIPARRSADGARLTGQAVVHAVEPDDVLLITAEVSGREAQFLVPASSPGVVLSPAASFDLSSRFSAATFDDVLLDESMEVDAPVSAPARRQLDLACLLAVADAAGAMSRLLDMTVDYAKVRSTFGRLIGSYQALKHQLADASFLLVSSEAVGGSLVDAQVEDHADLSAIASIAKAWVSDAAFEVAQICLQVHGGIGFAWEHDLHLFQRRLATTSLLWGTATHHRDWLARRGLDQDGGA